jgi:hypothetical protein
MAWLFLIFVLLPGAVTLLLPKRWLPFWLGPLALLFVWLWTQPLDGPSAGLAYFGIIIMSALHALFFIARAIKIAFDNDREQ